MKGWWLGGWLRVAGGSSALDPALSFSLASTCFSSFNFFLFRIFRIEWASHLLPICYNNEAGDVRVEIKALRPASETGGEGTRHSRWSVSDSARRSLGKSGRYKNELMTWQRIDLHTRYWICNAPHSCRCCRRTLSTPTAVQ